MTSINDIKPGDTVRILDVSRIMFAKEFGYVGGEVVVVQQYGSTFLPAIPTLLISEEPNLVITPDEFEFLEKLG